MCLLFAEDGSVALDVKGLQNAHQALLLAPSDDLKASQGVCTVGVTFEQVLGDGSLTCAASSLAEPLGDMLAGTHCQRSRRSPDICCSAVTKEFVHNWGGGRGGR